jgi:predicted nucleic acid-binding protein
MVLLIGATAFTEDLALITRNVRHFARLPDLQLYQPS